MKAGPARVDADALRSFVARLFVAAEMPEEDAALVAEALVWANLRGQDGHGVMRVPRYIELMRSGEMNVRPKMTVAVDLPAMLMLHADGASGPIAMKRASELAVTKARACGVGLAMVRATTHTAALGFYTSMIAKEGMAALSVAASIPNMAYHGARAAGVSTSPISIAVPGRANDIVLDMATAKIAIGKIAQARRLGQPLPPDSVLDREGNPTTDPKAAAVPLPIAGPKGGGLSLMVECLTSLAVGNAILAPEIEQGRPLRHRQNALVMAIDLAQLGELESYRREADRLARALKSLPRAPDVDEILIPGERGTRNARDRSAAGIPIPPGIFEELASIAREFGIPMLESRAG